MGDSTPIKNRRSKVVSSQKIRMPDAILHSRNIMIPIVRPSPFRQSCDTTCSENRRFRQILRAENHKNYPALLYSETPSHTLYDPLENSLEVTRTDRWKAKNQSTKYTIFGKTEHSPSIEKITVSQNSYPSRRLSRKKRNTLRFPNTVPARSEPSTDEKNLHGASSRSIKLSRKCDLSQMREETQTNHQDMSALLPKIETPVSSVTSKPVVSLSSQSFCDIVDTVSTVSTLSSFKIKNKKTFPNIVNRANAISNTASNHLYPSNSEYEINVLHYENDILSENNFSQSHLKCTNTNWSSAHNCDSKFKIQDDNNNLLDERNVKTDDIKYSWEMDNWLSLSQRKELDNTREKKIAKRNGKLGSYDCKIKYSWQVIGTGTQTSYTLLQDLLNDAEDNKSAYKMCIKYSWQIIGISTQVSLHDYDDPDYWNGMLLTPSKNYNENKAEIAADRDKLLDYARYPEGRSKGYLILNNQQTQTFAEKEIQADPNDCYAKYSWHSLIKQYL